MGVVEDAKENIIMDEIQQKLVDELQTRIRANYILSVKESIKYSEALIKHSEELILIQQRTIEIEKERIALEKEQLKKFDV